MTASALQTIPNETKPATSERIPKRVRQAVDMLLSGECRTQKAAAVQAGIAPETLSRYLGRSHVQAWMDARLRRANGALKVAASGTLTRLLESAVSEHVQSAVALKVLARELEPAPASVNVGVSIGYVIDLSGGRSPSDGPIIDVSPSEDEPGAR